MTIFKHVFSMAMVSLIVLVIQNSLLVVMTRFSRKNVDAAMNYHTSTLVLNQECVKMLMCLVVYAFDDVWKQFHRESRLAPDGTNTTAAAVAVVVKEAPEEVEASSLKDETLSVANLKSAEEKTLSPNEPHDGSQWKDSAAAATPSIADDASVAVAVNESEGEETSAKLLAAPPQAMRRNLRTTTTIASPSSPSSPVAATVDADEHAKPTDATVPRKNRLRFAWMRTQAAVSLFCSMLRVAVVKRDTLKLLVPAFLFNMQNFLIFVGLSNLDAVSFQVWSQTKLLSTALFSVWLLHRKLSLMQWLSLVALTAGVLGAQLGAPKGGSASAAAALITTTSTSTVAPRQLFGLQKRLTRTVSVLDADAMDGDEEPQSNAMIGIAACVLSGLSSSYAGVYFEKVVKTTSPTLSIRNIQLSIFGIPFAFLSMLLLDVIPLWYEQHQCGDAVHWNIFRNPFVGNAATVHYGADGECPVRPFYFWQRYDHLLTWGLVGIHAFGGLLVAIVVKYADNILKGFATGVAVIVSGMMSSAIWGYKPSLAFVLGAVLVIGSSIMFHKFEPKR